VGVGGAIPDDSGSVVAEVGLGVGVGVSVGGRPGNPASPPGSAMAAQGCAMSAPVDADTAARRRPDTRVTRRDVKRGLM
jgi:hypothetical protein